MNGKDWLLIDTLVRLENKWIKMVGERVENESGQRLDYWRVERCNSVIVIPIHKNRIILPLPKYRHGIGKTTYDFPGGRCEDDSNLKGTVLNILKQELLVDSGDVVKLTAINHDGWIVDSSFSNQCLFAFEALLAPDMSLNPSIVYMSQPADTQGAMEVLQFLTCLQCRGALLEWMTRFL
jgi:hypothetical protein